MPQIAVLTCRRFGSLGIHRGTIWHDLAPDGTFCHHLLPFFRAYWGKSRNKSELFCTIFVPNFIFLDVQFLAYSFKVRLIRLSSEHRCGTHKLRHTGWKNDTGAPVCNRLKRYNTQISRSQTGAPSQVEVFLSWKLIGINSRLTVNTDQDSFKFFIRFPTDFLFAARPLDERPIK